MNSYEHILDTVIAIIVIFLFPLLFFGQKQDALLQTVVAEETQELVDDIRCKGYLTKERYDTYLEKLSYSGLLYEVNIKHRQLFYEPEYRFRTPEEIIEEQDMAFHGSNTYHYYPVSTDIPVVVDPVNTGSLNTDTNESVLAAALNIPASPSHVHTDDCYDGDKHTHIGSATSGGGCYGKTQTSSVYCGSFVRDVHIEYNCTGTCSYCGKKNYIYTLGPPANHGCMGCFTNETGYRGTVIYTYTIDVYYFCSNCSSMNRTYGATHNKSVTTYAINCGKTEGVYYNGNVVAPAICNQIITSIMPTHTNQTVASGDPLITTVTAYFQDGSTKVVVATTNFSTATIVQNETVTLTYTYIISGVPYTKTCTITINVISRSRTCSNEHSYHLNEDGSDPGCPFCHAWLRELSVVIPETGTITIYKGTTLPDNGVTLLATYLDGRTEHLYSEYIDNLDAQYVGSQSVTLSYKGKYVSLTVINKRNLKLCSTCGRYYELHPDGSDPGCPYCISLTPIFTGNIMKYFDERYTDEILKELYEGSGIYSLTDRDYLIFHVENKTKSWGIRLLGNIHKNLGDSSIRVIYGGYIREDGGLE